MKAYRYNVSTRIYEGEINCQKDPIASRKAGEDVWLLPAHSTFDKPLDPKENYNVIWNGSAWEYQIIPQPEPAPEPTPEEIKERRIAELKLQLSDTDYKIIKCSEYQLAGLELPYDVVALHSQRQAIRNEINELEGE